jgi:hypothetical protein
MDRDLNFCQYFTAGTKCTRGPAGNGLHTPATRQDHGKKQDDKQSRVAQHDDSPGR